MNISTLIMIFCLLCLAVMPVQCKTRALLIGINYQHLPHSYVLEGPAYDVEVLKQLLIEKWQVNSKDITILLEEQASKENILTALKELSEQSRRGDFFIFYYSGHGTSKQDRSFGGHLPLPYNTGALVPHDFNWQGSLENQFDSLIVGRQHIKPYFTRMNENGVYGLAIVDACFSANATRSPDLNQYRFLPLGKGLAVKNNGTNAVNKTISVQKNNFQDYPYSTIVQLAAAGKHEKAQELGSDKVHKTHDGKPHGAFSDSLFRVLKDEQDADLNNDNSLSYRELFTAVKTKMADNHYPHKPVLLPQSGAMIRQKIYPSQYNDYAPGKTQADVLSFLVPQDAFIIRKAVESEPHIKLKDEHFDYKVKKTFYGYQLWSDSGEKIIEVDSEHEMVSVIKLQPLLRKIRQYKNKRQNFSLDVQLMPEGVGETYIKGEHIQFYINSGQAAYVAMLDITADGNIILIYPHEPGQEKKKDAHEIVSFKAKVSAPFGYEQVFVLAFKQQNVFYRRLLQYKEKIIRPHSPMHKQVIKTLLSDDANRSSSSFTLMTLEQ